MGKLKDNIAAFLVAALLRAVSLLPLRASQAIGTLIGLVNVWAKTRAAMVTRANLELCLPGMSDSQREEFVRNSLMHTGRTMMETPAVWLGSLERMSKWIRHVDNEEILENALAGGRGIIFLLPHLGNWELFNVYYARRSRLTALYNPPRKKYLGGLMSRIRLGFGNELVPANVKGIATLYRRLKDGNAVVVLPDQVPASGVYAPFFGVDALTDKLIHRLIQKTGARVIPVYLKRLDGSAGFDVVFREVDADIYSEDLMTSARALNATVEACVRDIPEQYQWEYKRFRERPTGERKIYRFNRPEAWH